MVEKGAELAMARSYQKIWRVIPWKVAGFIPSVLGQQVKAQSARRLTTRCLALRLKHNNQALATLE